MPSIPVRFRHFVPGPSEVVFALVLMLVLAGGRYALLNDPGTLWHLRLGRDILATGAVPRCDSLTFTHTGAPWVDQSWGFDVLLAKTIDLGGWPLAIALTALLLAGLYAAVARGLIRDGASPLVALLVAILMAGTGCIHFLIRPHLFTFVFVWLTFRLCQKQHESGGWSVAWVPLFTGVLANLHGGFLALPAILATALVGHAISGPWDRPRASNVAKFALATIASVLAALVNPYGLDLYRHVVNLLVGSGVTRLIDEYQPAAFGESKAQALELVVLALVCVPAFTSIRIDRYRMAHVLVWLHLALTSFRNAPLFAFAAAPVLATLLDGLPTTLRTQWKDPARPFFWIPGISTALLLFVFLGFPLGGFDGRKWPLAAMPSLDQQDPASHLFHEQDWGGLIAAECRPPRRTYLDDRFELFGRATILEYVDALTGGPTWDVVRDRDKIGLVWLRPDRGLARRLLAEPGWHVIYRDGVSVLFRRETTCKHVGWVSEAQPTNKSRLTAGGCAPLTHTAGLKIVSRTVT